MSKIKVSPEETLKGRTKYKKLKKIDGIIKLLSIRTNKSMEYLYENIVWPLYNKNNRFNAFETISLNGGKKILKKLNIEEDIKNELINIIKIRMAPRLKEIRSTFKLVCYAFNGIDSIKESLLSGKNIEENDCPIIYKLISSPEYECIIYSYDKTYGINLMNFSLEIVKKEIEQKGGYFLMEKEPEVINSNKNKLW